MFSPVLAEIRFGCGLSPDLQPKGSVEDILHRLAGPDHMAIAHPTADFDSFWPQSTALKALRQKRGLAEGTDAYDDLNAQYKAMRREARFEHTRWFGQIILRHSQTEDGFRERLALFWGDHFTAQGKSGLAKRMGAPYVDAAIRPYVSGRFADLLISAVTHPLMLHYLDQHKSIGPNSRVAEKSSGQKGLNENLAREVMELHTLGVGGPYTQRDVRQLAELFTGLGFKPKTGFQFKPNMAEPGPETVLGTEYGGDPAQLEAIHMVLADLALHPATAQHVARKLVVHFVSDRPDPVLVGHVAARFRDTDGDLAQVYAALLEHPAAWRPELRNVKPPLDFIASACRALALRPAHLNRMAPKRLAKGLLLPMVLMGQPWERSNGPDGWPEEDAAWITPQGLAARMRWAMLAPRQLAGRLPPPEKFVETSLGGYADGPVRFAARAAETQAEAIGLVLSSPAFQRR
ncbi:DUF1800 domain-containing protein [Parasedimentitalea psychrophila]|uniref:DUF1800 domain-containing protein n=1 Tax=Parasedimentitalea psychrophila TaxID=2997337 RepID=A0A9Y2KVL1_9RHOB|nr:DUF1800 domain-containing protein [Parasedimentitalea psychrophila]WIY23488.1 DUF1800 domain-containing protein [Parasedimentitalea psychrophila]